MTTEGYHVANDPILLTLCYHPSRWTPLTSDPHYGAVLYLFQVTGHPYGTGRWQVDLIQANNRRPMLNKREAVIMLKLLRDALAKITGRKIILFFMSRIAWREA